MSKFKILYAARNNDNAKIVLSRFITKMMEQEPRFSIKIAAYQKSSPEDLSIDWTLDCLLNIFRPEHFSIEENENFSIYFDQVKKYAPDLIISDLEYFTSYIANNLNILLWQCSSSLINYGVTNEEKYNLGLFKKFSYLTNRNPINTQRHVNIIDNSNRNFIYSHFGDTLSPPKLKSNFEWIRPYHSIGKISIPCKHHMMAVSLFNNKKIINLCQNYSEDVVIFTFNHLYEKYDQIVMKNYHNLEEYFCNLKNCSFFLHEGQTSFLADAYYNNKYSLISINFDDPESITNSIFSEKLQLGSHVYEIKDLNIFPSIIQSSYCSQIKFLHQKIDEIL